MSSFGRKLTQDNQTLFRKGMTGMRTFGRKYGSTIKKSLNTLNEYGQPILTAAEFVQPQLSPEIAAVKYGLRGAATVSNGLFTDEPERKARNPRLER